MVNESAGFVKVNKMLQPIKKGLAALSYAVASRSIACFKVKPLATVSQPESIILAETFQRVTHAETA